METRPESHEIVVAHKPIENYMPAMTMPFHVADWVRFANLAPGTRVEFDLKVGKHSSVAQNIQVRETILDVTLPKPPRKPPVGEKIADFALTDQTGKPMHLSDFLGKILVVDFIYTRCPLPDVCPRLSANFASLSKKMPDVEFLSITIDPQYDTPEVLTEYAKRWQAGASWRFLTGTGEQVREVAEVFGLVYWPEEGSITHTVATAVIGRDGTLRAQIDGAGYRPDQLKALIEHALK